MEPRSISQQIAAYLVENPGAEDTVEGITEWWLLSQRIQVAVNQVRSAITELAAQGFLSASRGRDGRIRFGLNPAHRAELTAWLTGDPPPQRQRRTTANTSTASTTAPRAKTPRRSRPKR